MLHVENRGKSMKLLGTIGLATSLALVPCYAAASPIEASGRYNHHTGGWDRGYQSTMYCGNSPESWVRGNARLDPSSGLVSVDIQLETDSNLAGPKGKIVGTVRDADGKTLTTFETNEFSRGGKQGGTFQETRHTVTIKLDPATVAKAASLSIEAQCTGSALGIFGADPQEVLKALGIIVKLM